MYLKICICSFFDALLLRRQVLKETTRSMGGDLSFGKGHGPRFANPVRTLADNGAAGWSRTSGD